MDMEQIKNELSFDERQLIREHQQYTGFLSWDAVVRIWREGENVCVSYLNAGWWHYNVARGEWW